LNPPTFREKISSKALVLVVDVHGFPAYPSCDLS